MSPGPSDTRTLPSNPTVNPSTPFIDWLTIYQDFDHKLPMIADQVHLVMDAQTGERITERQPNHQHEGSHSTTIQITISGDRLKVSGNPSKINRLDNLFGYSSIEECVNVYNNILASYGLPLFTKCKKRIQRYNEKNKRFELIPDGAVITEIHLTTNKEVGKGNTQAYLKGLSTQKYRNSIPHLFSNQRTLDWKTKKGNASLIYPSVYDKAHELDLRTAPKIKRLYGETSEQYQYIKSVIRHCQDKGVLRFETKFKSRFLRRENLTCYGLINYQELINAHNEFKNIDERLQVNNMDIQNISERLLITGIVNNTKAANTTSMYAIQWMHGHHFDLSNRNVQRHRARLRKIGIDIGLEFDSSQHSPVFVTKVTEIKVKESIPPAWYRHAENTNQLSIH